MSENALLTFVEGDSGLQMKRYYYYIYIQYYVYSIVIHFQTNIAIAINYMQYIIYTFKLQNLFLEVKSMVRVGSKEPLPQ